MGGLNFIPKENIRKKGGYVKAVTKRAAEKASRLRGRCSWDTNKRKRQTLQKGTTEREPGSKISPTFFESATAGERCYKTVFEKKRCEVGAGGQLFSLSAKGQRL